MAKKTTSRKGVPLPPTLEDLRYFLQLWNAAHLLQRRGKKIGARTVQRFAMAEFGAIERADPVKELRRIGDYFGRKFFLKRGFSPDPNCAGLASEIADCLRSLDRFVSREDSAIRLRLGVGHSVSMSLAPKIVARFREKCPLINVEIIVDNSVSLRSKNEQLEADLILTALPPSYDTHNAEHKINLRPALIAPRHHEAARRFRDSGRPFLDPALLTPKSDEGPSGHYVIHIYEGPQPAIPIRDDWFDGISVRFMRQSSYALINELVACGNDLGVTLPHLLTVEQWRRVEVMPFEKLEEAQLSLLSVAKMPGSGARYVSLMDKHFNKEFSNALNCLTRIAIEEMDALEKLSNNYEQPPAVTYRCFLEMPLKKFGHKRYWLQGCFAQHKGDDRSFVGDFKLHSVWHGSEWIPLEVLGEDSIHFKSRGVLSCNP
jgi:DNA-binding transcriptional LysR family regulator